jgi:hypothetical protein
MKLKELSVQRGEQQKQLLGYLSTSCKLSDLLEEEAEYAKEMIEKFKVEWVEEINNKMGEIEVF